VRSFFLLLVFTFLIPAPTLAHRVNVFAYVEGGEVVVECSYSKSKRVRHGTIAVQDAGSGETLLQGTTDEEGLFRFSIPDQARTSGSSLRVLLQAGEGHQNEWIVDAAEFMDAGAPRPLATNAEASAASAGAMSPGRTDPNAAGLSRADVEDVVNAALDAKLAPIRRALLEQSQSGPGMREIIGGIGWIFGLVGIGAYFKSRPRV
jgi:nickel transport protein